MPRLGLALLAYGILIAAVSLLWEQPDVLLAALLVLAAALLAITRSRRTVGFFFVAGVLGPAAESIAIAHGAWAYAGTDTLIPLWLPPAWGLAGVCLVLIVEALVPFREDAPRP